MITVRQLLDRKGRAIYSVSPSDPVLAAIRLMADHHIGALLVMQGDTLTGILSERDYARKVILLGRAADQTSVSQIMTSQVTTIAPEDTVDHCMRIVTEQRIRHLPVVENNRVVGVVSIGDLVKAVIEDQQHTIEQLESYIHS
jgi:CBS domain-containing protein